MKKYLCMAAAGMFLFSACSNDDDAINNGGNTAADFEGQELVMKVTNGGDGLTTRAGRPLYSSEAGQMIDKVKVAIFKLSGTDIESCVYVKEFNDWSTTSGTNYGDKIDGSVDHGKYASLNLKKEIVGTGDVKGLDPGDYKVYAIGYTSTGSNYTEYSPALTDIAKDWVSAANFTYVSATTSTDGEEIFAGEIEKITVDKDRNFTVVANEPENNILYLHRQVAGAFGYFKNIPVAGPDGTKATKLRLVASDKNTKLNMTAFNTGFRTTGDKIAYVVNGETSATTADAKFKAGTDAYTVYEITLSDWFTGSGMDTNNDGVLNENDDWSIPTDMQGEFNAITGTVFDGKFVIPFANKKSNTFELQLVNGDGANAKILRTWSVNLASAQTNVKGIDGSNIENESVSSYSIVRNHLYTIGRKDIAKPTDPVNPTDPENPEDLSKGQILTLRVNDNWEVIHKLEVEPEI